MASELTESEKQRVVDALLDAADRMDLVGSAVDDDRIAEVAMCAREYARTLFRDGVDAVCDGNYALSCVAAAYLVSHGLFGVREALVLVDADDSDHKDWRRSVIESR